MNQDVTYQLRTFVNNGIAVEETAPRSKKDNEVPSEYRLLVNVVAPDAQSAVLLKILLNAATLEQAYFLMETKEQIQKLIEEELARQEKASQKKILQPGRDFGPGPIIDGRGN